MVLEKDALLRVAMWADGVARITVVQGQPDVDALAADEVGHLLLFLVQRPNWLGGGPGGLPPYTVPRELAVEQLAAAAELGAVPQDFRLAVNQQAAQVRPALSIVSLVSLPSSRLEAGGPGSEGGGSSLSLRPDW